jgi:NAD(P)-dependent dehydrogenase (short-subunit alcohol dehydrogenase family)
MTTIRTEYGHDATAADVARGIDLAGRRIIVTGGASGIGVETARALAGTGADVTLAVRDLAAGKRTAAEIAETTGNAGVHVAQLDLADRASIAAFVAAWTGPLHVLVNNAGVMACPETRTPEGWELQFATNHLGHFALALGLRGALATDGAGRIVAVSSGAHRRSPVVFDDIHFERRTYDPWLAYGQSKTANALFAVEAARRLADDGITANALMPGVIATNLQRHMDEETRAQLRSGGFAGVSMKTPEQGAATSVLLAASPQVAGVSGRYFEDCNEAHVTSDTEVSSGVRTYALDPDAAQRLWEASLRMLETPPVPR